MKVCWKKLETPYQMMSQSIWVHYLSKTHLLHRTECLEFSGLSRLFNNFNKDGFSEIGWTHIRVCDLLKVSKSLWLQQCIWRRLRYFWDRSNLHCLSKRSAGTDWDVIRKTFPACGTCVRSNDTNNRRRGL